MEYTSNFRQPYKDDPLYGPQAEKICLRGLKFANNKGADQPAHSDSLINTYSYSLIEKYHI